MPTRKLSWSIALLASCGSPAHVESVKPEPVAPDPWNAPLPPPPAIVPPAPVAAADPPVADLPAPPAWTPHRCKHTVWPSYDPDSDAEPTPEVRTGLIYPERNSEIGGRTLDDRAADAFDGPSRGVCDVRKRVDLEAGLAGLPAPGRGATPTRWDRGKPLGNADVVRAALALTPDEERRLASDGLVVPARLAYQDYTQAYYDIHRGQLPVYVSADSILHAVYASHDQLLGGLESQELVDRLDGLLGAMHCGLAVAAKDYPSDVANDVDLYLTVARSLLADAAVPSELGTVDADAHALVNLVRAAGPVATVELFGRTRAIDASAYTPRGHYTATETLTRYFRAAMWLSRIELNLVSRDSRSSQPGYQPDPRETPREAVVALALADLAERTKATRDVAAIDQVWSAFAGRREDVPFAELGKLRTKARIARLVDPDAAAKLRAAIGDGFQRSVNVHPMPNVAHLPVIATMIGPRITPDTTALGAIVGGRGPDVTAPEIGYMLGQDRGLAYLPADLKPRLDDARRTLDHAPRGDDLYTAWLDAIRGLGHKPDGALPAFMTGDAFADLRLDTALVAYGQLRHNHVLISAQIYDQGGCEIPDGYVEPALDTYKALVHYAQRGKAVFAAIDPKHTTNGVKYFERLERLMSVFVALSREELANRPLSPSAKRFLAMIVEMRETMHTGYNGSFPVATYNGWYLDLFPYSDLAFQRADFIADYATFDRNGAKGIHYLGAKGPQLGVFVVDTGGEPRVMVGPVARGYQHVGPLDLRLDDTTADTVTGTAPWAASYTVAAPAAPDVAIEFSRASHKRRRRADPSAPPELPPGVVRIDSARAGDLTVDLLDHHFVTMTSLTIKVAAGRTDVPAPPVERPIEGIRIHAGAFTGRLDLDLEGHGRAAFGLDPGPPR